jgi:anion-transporting  ArsA/GET3 family ATPase
MVLPVEACRTPYARARWQMQQAYLADIEARFAVPVLEVPLLDGEVVGLERLGELLDRTLAPTSLVA